MSVLVSSSASPLNANQLLESLQFNSILRCFPRISSLISRWHFEVDLCTEREGLFLETLEAERFDCSFVVTRLISLLLLITALFNKQQITERINRGQLELNISVGTSNPTNNAPENHLVQQFEVSVWSKTKEHQL